MDIRRLNHRAGLLREAGGGLDYIARRKDHTRVLKNGREGCCVPTDSYALIRTYGEEKRIVLDSGAWQGLAMSQRANCRE